jgi:hypothetical protein
MGFELHRLVLLFKLVGFTAFIKAMTTLFYYLCIKVLTFTGTNEQQRRINKAVRGQAGRF